MAYIIITNLIPTSLYPLKATYPMSAKYITIHNTANDATAINEIAYMTRNKNATSYHVAIDDKHVVQGIPFTRNGWHAGDGNGDGNRQSIGIEICYSKSGGARYKESEENTIEYVAYLLKKFGWNIDRVKWHRDWSGKNCPHRIIDEGRMLTVRNKIAKRLAELNTVKPILPKEDIRMFNPSSATLKAAFEQYLVEAVKKGLMTDKWLTDYRAGKLSLDDALALKVIIDQREKKE
ncbi:peptidoglycan recognition protein family protein [Sporosarcina sp. FSL K6-3457]|uniref:peptidoglycan recognition protein family protein n=1 Tax=Sporosarcina sp. FSL K6-3457 TaxID=2978204 RepID=UPI0040469EA3